MIFFFQIYKQKCSYKICQNRPYIIRLLDLSKYVKLTKRIKDATALMFIKQTSTQPDNFFNKNVNDTNVPIYSTIWWFRKEYLLSDAWGFNILTSFKLFFQRNIFTSTIYLFWFYKCSSSKNAVIPSDRIGLSVSLDYIF